MPKQNFSYYEESTSKVPRNATIRILFEKNTVTTFSRTNKKGKRYFKLWHHLRTPKKKANTFQQSEAFRQMIRLEKKVFHLIFKNNSHAFLNYCSTIQYVLRKEMKRLWTNWLRLQK